MVGVMHGFLRFEGQFTIGGQIRAAVVRGIVVNMSIFEGRYGALHAAGDEA
jgi:hypothetical protein